MKLLHAAKFYPPAPGGMERMLGDLCDGTAREWEVRVVAAGATTHTIEERCGEVTVLRAAAWGSAHAVPLCPSLPFHLWRSRADCVVLHEPNPVAGTALFLRTPAPRLLIWHHSDLLRPRWAPHTYGRIQCALYRRADCVIVSSPALAAGSSLVQCARRIAVIPFGVDLEQYRRTDAASRGRIDALRARHEGPLVLFVGRLVYYKGVEVLLEAMTRCPGTLLIVGVGPLEGALRELAIRKGLDDRVRFVGQVSDEELPVYYQACDLFVLPSIARTETFGIVQVEAMAAGVPVVSTNLSTGVPWVNQDGVSGLVVPPGDADALGGAICRLGSDAALRRLLGEGGRARAASLFSRERMVASFKNVVETAVCDPARLDQEFARTGTP
jgi:glycosyltransferase involved in cell wall biosynthesis